MTALSNVWFTFLQMAFRGFRDKRIMVRTKSDQANPVIVMSSDH